MRRTVVGALALVIVAGLAQGDPTSFYPGMRCLDKSSSNTCSQLFPGGCCYTDSVLRIAVVPTNEMRLCGSGSQSDCCVIQINSQYEVTCSGNNPFWVARGTVCGWNGWAIGFPTCESKKWDCRDATLAEWAAGLCDSLSP